MLREMLGFFVAKDLFSVFLVTMYANNAKCFFFLELIYNNYMMLSLFLYWNYWDDKIIKLNTNLNWIFHNFEVLDTSKVKALNLLWTKDLS